MASQKIPETFELNKNPSRLYEEKENRLSLKTMNEATVIMRHLYPNLDPEGPYISRTYGYPFMNCLTIQYMMSAYNIPFYFYLDFPEWPKRYEDQQLFQLRVELPEVHNLTPYRTKQLPIAQKAIVTLNPNHPTRFFTTVLTNMYLRSSFTCQLIATGTRIEDNNFPPYI